MLLAELLPIVRAYWLILLTAAVVIHLVRNKFNNGLNKYPGHPLAGYTNWWRFFDAWSRKAEKTHVALHRRYGDIVRLGPNVLSFADPRAIKIIYGLNKGMTKSDFYPVQQVGPDHTQITKLLLIHAIRPLRRVNVCNLCSARRMKNTTRSTADA